MSSGHVAKAVLDLVVSNGLSRSFGSNYLSGPTLLLALSLRENITIGHKVLSQEYRKGAETWLICIVSIYPLSHNLICQATSAMP